MSGNRAHQLADTVQGRALPALGCPPYQRDPKPGRVSARLDARISAGAEHVARGGEQLEQQRGWVGLGLGLDPAHDVADDAVIGVRPQRVGPGLGNDRLGLVARALAGSCSGCSRSIASERPASYPVRHASRISSAAVRMRWCWSPARQPEVGVGAPGALHERAFVGAVRRALGEVLPLRGGPAMRTSSTCATSGPTH